jgi:hypothetical protein
MIQHGYQPARHKGERHSHDGRRIDREKWLRIPHNMHPDGWACDGQQYGGDQPNSSSRNGSKRGQSFPVKGKQ